MLLLGIVTETAPGAPAPPKTTPLDFGVTRDGAILLSVVNRGRRDPRDFASELQSCGSSKGQTKIVRFKRRARDINPAALGICDSASRQGRRKQADADPLPWTNSDSGLAQG